MMTFISNSILLLFMTAALIRLAVHGKEINRTTIRVSKDGHDLTKCWENSSFPCKSLQFALTKPNLNNTVILLLAETHNLESNSKVENTTNFQLRGVDSQHTETVVKCSSINQGLSFFNSRDLNFYGFSLQGCGARYLSTSKLNNKSFEFVYTALHLKKCSNVLFKNVTIRNSNGTGAVFYDVGGAVTFENTEFKNNILNNASCKRGFSSGGGLYIDFPYKENPKEETIRYSTYTFKKCNFIGNVAEYEYSYPTTGKGFDEVSFGRGGGLSILLSGNASNNSFTISSSVFENNKALWGAGVFFEVHDKAGNNNLILNGNVFSGNNATYGGGGVRTGMASTHYFGKNNIYFTNCTFTENSARIGAGVSQYRVYKSLMEQETTIFRKCNFTLNRAFLGFAIHISLSQFVLRESIIVDNRVVKDDVYLSGKGAIYCFSSTAIFMEENTIKSNFETAMVLEFSHLMLYDKTSFVNNTGIDGGALALYGDSWINLMEKSKVFFIRNKALHSGGAIYVKTPGPPMAPFESTEFQVYNCAILFGSNNGDPNKFKTTVHLVNNTAPPAAGGTIFMSTLNWCRLYGEPKYNNTALQWSTFHYQTSDAEPTIVTNPVLVEINESDWKPAPSIAFQPSLVLRDELWNNVTGTIKITIISIDKLNPVTLRGSDVFAVRGRLPRISLNGKEQAPYSVRIETAMGVSIQVEIQNRKLKKCPIGYYQNRNGKTCNCLSDKGFEIGVTQCNGDKINILKGRWGDPLGGKDQFARQICPPNYCQKCVSPNNQEGIDCVYRRENQCGNYRRGDSVLCGSCLPGYSVKLGSEECEQCDNFGLFWLILWMLVLTLLVLIVMWLNLDTYSTYLNAYLYSYQVIPLLVTGNKYIDHFLSFVMGMANFSGTGGNIGVCLWNGMNDMEKLFLNYLTPSYIVACTAAVGAFAYYCRCCPFNKITTFRALVLLSVFSYADFTRITFELLHPVTVRGKAVLYLQGDIELFSREHVWYAVIAIIVLLVVVIMFPLSLIFFHLFTARSSFVKLKGIFDTFQEPFKDGMERFSAFYLLSRCVLLVFSIFLPEGTLKDILQAFSCEVILIVFMLSRPYKENRLNLFDTLLLANITFISTINVGLGAVTVQETRLSLQKTAAVLAYLPVLCIILQLLYWVMNKLRVCLSKKEGNLSARGRQKQPRSKFPERPGEDVERRQLHSPVQDVPYVNYDDF